MIPKHSVSFPMFGSASLATASEHKICNAASPGSARQKPMGLRACQLIGLLWCYRSDIHHYGWGGEGGIPQVPGLARWISTAGDKEEKSLAELYNIMARWARRDRRKPKGCTGRCNMCGGKTELSSMGNLTIATGKDKNTADSLHRPHWWNAAKQMWEIALYASHSAAETQPPQICQRQWWGWRSTCEVQQKCPWSMPTCQLVSKHYQQRFLDAIAPVFVGVWLQTSTLEVHHTLKG